MTPPRCQTPDCGRPSAHTSICSRCTTQLAHTLRTLPTLLTQLEITTSRQTRHGIDPGVRSRNAERPLPFPWAAADLLTDAIPNTLATWAADLAHTHQLAPPAKEGPAELAVWLHSQLTAIQRHPRAGELTDEVQSISDTTQAAIDNPPTMHYAGPCHHCAADLYGWPTATTTTCCQCHTPHDMTQRRAWLLQVIEDKLLYPEEIASAISAWLGTPISRDRIRKWVQRERLIPHTHDAEGRRMYRGGDAIDLARRAATRNVCA